MTNAENVGVPTPSLPAGLAPAPSLFWLDALPQAVLLYRRIQEDDSLSLSVTGMNRAASELWGVTPERALGRPLLEVVRRHTLEALAQRGGCMELDASGRTFRCWGEVQGSGGALILEDVSLQRRREAELREATAVLSHEFRTPVAALRGVLEALEYDMPAEMQQNFVSQGLQETQRLARLVEDLAVGFRPTRARTVPLAEAFARAGRLLESEHAGCSERLSFGDNYLVRADPDKLLQVLLNLVGNALKYGPKGGEVSVETAQGDEDITVAVLDDGPPISDTEGLFQAHTRGRHVTGQGSGMGLYIVRSIVQGWGGSAWAERRGERNAFCFNVPAVRD